MSNPELTAGDCIRRALQAAEIAESCYEPTLRRRFFEASSQWLAKAGLTDAEPGRRVSGGDGAIVA